jgi:hypothetical protein
MIGTRTRLSLAQYLDRQSGPSLDVLFAKHGVTESWIESSRFAPDTLSALVRTLKEMEAGRLLALIEEVVATEPALRDQAIDQWGTGAAAYGARRADLLRCLLLDGYEVSNARLIAVGPELEGASTVEDALAAEIVGSTLPSAPGITHLLEQSAQGFRQVPPDYNACLSNARTALQTLATQIALERQKKQGGSFQSEKWGQVLSYLRTSDLIGERDERLISSVYTFISPGAHRPIQLSEAELVRLGRGMAISLCYFLIRLHKESMR